MAIAAARLVMIGSADAQSSKIPPADVPTITPGSNTSFGALKQIDADARNRARYSLRAPRRETGLARLEGVARWDSRPEVPWGGAAP